MSILRLAAPASKPHASVAVPGDKSISHRALMLAALCRTPTTLIGVNAGDDVEATGAALRALGVSIKRKKGVAIVRGRQPFRSPRRTLDCGNSGTTMRLLMGLLAGRVAATLDGDASLRRRPMERVAVPLRQMGAVIATAAHGRPPVAVASVAAPLQGIDYRLPVASAQVKSALLLAGLNAEGTTRIETPLPSRDHTERMLRAFGARITYSQARAIVRPGALTSPGAITVPGDFSSAFYLMCAAALVDGSVLRLTNVGLNPSRIAALRTLRRMGARIAIGRQRSSGAEPSGDVIVRGGGTLQGVGIDTHLVPNLQDEIPALCAVAAFAHGRTRIVGAAELRVKESDRLKTTVALLRSFGARARELKNGIVVDGPASLRTPKFTDTHGDHRIGMAAAILAAGARAAIVVRNADCIATSFPGFKEVWTAAFGG